MNNYNYFIKAKVRSEETGEWFETPIRMIILDDSGRAEAVIGATGLRYTEFDLVTKRND